MSDNAYAAAIIALADGLGDLDIVDGELTSIARAITANRDLRERLADIHTPANVRLKFVESEVLSAAHPTTRAALAMVIAGEAAGSIVEICSAVSDLAAEARDAQVAEVTVAQPLDDAAVDRLRTALEGKLGRRLTMKVVVDESLVGGVRVQVGDTVIDGSLAGRLSDIRTRLAG